MESSQANRTLSSLLTYVRYFVSSEWWRGEGRHQAREEKEWDFGCSGGVVRHTDRCWLDTFLAVDVTGRTRRCGRERWRCTEQVIHPPACHTVAVSSPAYNPLYGNRVRWFVWRGGLTSNHRCWLSMLAEGAQQTAFCWTSVDGLDNLALHCNQLAHGTLLWSTLFPACFFCLLKKLSQKSCWFVDCHETCLSLSPGMPDLGDIVWVILFGCLVNLGVSRTSDLTAEHQHSGAKCSLHLQAMI